MFSLICVWINGWVNNGEAGDLKRYRAHYDVTVMLCLQMPQHITVLGHHHALRLLHNYVRFVPSSSGYRGSTYHWVIWCGYSTWLMQSREDRHRSGKNKLVDNIMDESYSIDRICVNNKRETGVPSETKPGMFSKVWIQNYFCSTFI